MDCRTAHAMMGDTDTHASFPDELAHHLTECAACQNDATDPLGRLLTQVSGDFLQPSPNFTYQLMARLPQASPRQLARSSQQRWRWIRVASLVPVVCMVVALILGPTLQAQWAETTLGGVAATLRQIAGAFSWSLVLMLGSFVGVLALLVRTLRLPGPRGALGAAGVAVLLLAGTGLVGTANDQANAQAASTQGVRTATIASSLTLDQPVNGNVASMFGTIVVRQPVSGNVASMFGTVTLNAPVSGSVLVGSSGFRGDPALAQGGIVLNADQLALASSVPILSRVSWSPQVARLAISSVASLLLLALLGLTAALWPDPLARASTMLAAQPVTGAALGVLLAIGSMLALGLLVVLLAWSVIGLASLPLLLVVVHLPVICGLAVVGGTLAQRVFRRPTMPKSLGANAALLLILLTLTLAIPPLGAIVFYLVASVGFGAMLLSARRAAWM